MTASGAVRCGFKIADHGELTKEVGKDRVDRVSHGRVLPLILTVISQITVGHHSISYPHFMETAQKSILLPIALENVKGHSDIIPTPGSNRKNISWNRNISRR